MQKLKRGCNNSLFLIKKLEKQFLASQIF